MIVPVLTQPWVLVTLALYAAIASIVWHVESRFLRPPDVRWVLAASCGTCFAALLAPSPWIAGALLTIALSIPVSLLLFQHRISTVLAYPPTGATILAISSVWIVALGLVTEALRFTGSIPLFLAGLLALAGYSIAIGIVQVLHGIPAIVWHDAGFGEIGKPVRVPMAFLNNSWKLAAINAILLPAAIGLALPLTGWTLLLVLLVTGMLWQIWKAEGDTCLIAVASGILAGALAFGAILPVVVVGPLGLVAYPSLRARLLQNSRWDAWREAVRIWRESKWFGAGLGAWQGSNIRTSSEPGRVWHSVHNDWLETLLECGPLPVLCALGYLGTAVARIAGGVGPLEAGLFGSLVALAVLSLGYMPWRTWPVNLFGLGIIACWEAIGK